MALYLLLPHHVLHLLHLLNGEGLRCHHSFVSFLQLGLIVLCDALQFLNHFRYLFLQRFNLPSLNLAKALYRVAFLLKCFVIDL